MKDLIPLIGRILISAIFLISGYMKISNFAGVQHYMEAYGMPWPGFFLICAMILEFTGGLSVLLGYKARWGAIALIVFLIPTTIIFHTKFSEQLQMIMFMKNLGIIGGLLMVTNFGPGYISVDTLCHAKKDVC